ncbi:hypothetical protein DCAR_0104371 [Daucus carota subsp. sativus]|uniref:Terpene synthase N-terminal domain-containing protein n=1 Tax=Daucus carota subsp. sativus TaxID=79200 RepID=A0AAF1AJR8_DAUCS|nr:hypothetical protein DCAR_0104371 [Daucus carota subsp. sativus]
MIFKNVAEPLDQLELIDQLQRVGLDYHFQDEIKHALKSIQHNGQNSETTSDKNLHATALEFRLLRQHGHYISSDDAREWSNSTTDGSDGDRTPATTTIPARAAADELRAVDDDVGSGPGSTVSSGRRHAAVLLGVSCVCLG